MTAIKALGLELWSMTSDIYFDNFIVTSQKEVADRWASDSWGLKKLVASANEVSLGSCLRGPQRAGHGVSRALLSVLAPCSGDPAGDSRSADDGGGGTPLALDHLPADGGAARRPAGALLLAEGTTPT